MFPDEDEALCDTLEVKIQMHIDALRTILRDHPGAVRPFTGHCQIAKLGAEAIFLGIASGAVEPDEYAAAFTQALDTHTKAHVLFKLLGECLNPDTDQLTKAGRVMVPELFDVMGRHYAESLHRFSALYTKLA